MVPGWGAGGVGVTTSPLWKASSAPRGKGSARALSGESRAPGSAGIAPFPPLPVENCTSNAGNPAVKKREPAPAHSDKEPERNPGNKHHDRRVLQPRDHPAFAHDARCKPREEPLDQSRVAEDPVVEEEVDVAHERLGRA